MMNTPRKTDSEQRDDRLSLAKDTANEILLRWTLIYLFTWRINIHLSLRRNRREGKKVTIFCLMMLNVTLPAVHVSVCQYNHRKLIDKMPSGNEMTILLQIDNHSPLLFTNHRSRWLCDILHIKQCKHNWLIILSDFTWLCKWFI